MTKDWTMALSQSPRRAALQYLQESQSEALGMTVRPDGDVTECLNALQTLELTDVATVALLNEFGPWQLAPRTLSLLAERVAGTLRQRGLTVTDCLG